eukprot:4597533-Pleurochrysis_carterae.AAC.5
MNHRHKEQGFLPGAECVLLCLPQHLTDKKHNMLFEVIPDPECFQTRKSACNSTAEHAPADLSTPGTRS